MKFRVYYLAAGSDPGFVDVEADWANVMGQHSQHGPTLELIRRMDVVGRTSVAVFGPRSWTRVVLVEVPKP